MIPSFYQIGDKLVAARDIKLTNDGRPYYSLNARVIKLEDAEPGMISHSRLWTAAEAVHYQSTNASIKPKTSLNWAAPSQPRQQSAVPTPAETPTPAAISPQPQPRMEQPAPVANYAAKPTSAPVTTADPGLAHHDDLEATDHRTMFVVKRAPGGGTREPRPTSKKADAQRGEGAEATAQRGNHPKTHPRHAEAGEARGSQSDAGRDHPEGTPRHAG